MKMNKRQPIKYNKLICCFFDDTIQFFIILYKFLKLIEFRLLYERGFRQDLNICMLHV